MRSRLCLLAGMLALSACSLSPEELTAKTMRFAQKAGMAPLALPAGPFTLQGFERITNPAAPVRVFIEGDGKAWISVSQPSPDPTPYEPTALFLAAADDAPNVAYLARPCQFISGPACAIPVWTYRQFTEDKIAAMNQALNRWKGHKLELVGYSGGAAVALLLAARRNDVVSIRTAAGLLDNKAFTAHHGVDTPPPENLDPAGVMAKTAFIPQIHFAGENDKVVPPQLTKQYQAQLPAGNCSKVITVPNTTHLKGWPEHWPGLTARLLPCTQPQSYYQMLRPGS